MEITNETTALKVSTSGIDTLVKYSSIKSVSPLNTTAGHFVLIHFTDEITSTLRLKIKNITNQPTWTNDVVGTQTAVDDITNWMNE